LFSYQGFGLCRAKEADDVSSEASEHGNRHHQQLPIKRKPAIVDAETKV
jgi:hypothetical protein